ncbi:T9SS type A sorting domain-containing protein [Flavobacterium sp. SUN046]|uniref:T9SS type A sorting domain-containing protein n=1 Tax=Flavobacterium sp. SUN046 TaxID=3002440 RepID=UPI002DBE461F|nr:T9SS type A sorting domain-containing protein [Flavobacterium sp. SUN046]MEC4050933.1 T9SS type A sorting domain-containing protein [Flavobacterium sp. SUN046]
MNENGELEWQKDFGGSGSDFLTSIENTNDGGYIVAGNSNSNIGFDKKDNSFGKDDFWIIKLNSQGNEEWQKTIGGSGLEKLATIKQTNDGGYIIGGSSSSQEQTSIITSLNNYFKTEPCYGNLDYYVIKLNSQGKIEWQKTFGGEYVDEIKNIQPTSDGGYILGGYSNSPISGNKSQDNIGIGDYWIIKLNSLGKIEWQKTIGGDLDDQLSVIFQTYDNGYILGGNSNSNYSSNKNKENSEGTDFWILKLNNKGEILWQQTYNIASADILTSIVENDNHSYLLAGFAQGEINKNNSIKVDTADYVAILISEKGEELWRRIIGSHGDDFLKKAFETRDGGYILAGTSNAFSSMIDNRVSKSNTLTSNINQENNSQIENKKRELDDAIVKKNKAINDDITNTISNYSNSVKNSLGLNDNSIVKIDNPTAKIGGGLLKETDPSKSNNINDKKLPSSRDKSNSYGNNDFWVVKLKDYTKSDNSKVFIEALPNPTSQNTNIIVGYEFKKGIATVVDISGRQLQQFEIFSRTIPIDLSNYPVGIYIVNIKTDISNNGIKVIKTMK